MYHQYKRLDDILRKTRTGDVICGFMIEGSNKTCVLYGKNCREEGECDRNTKSK